MVTFLRFARLHTLVGTSGSILALYAIAVRHTAQTDWLLLAWTLLSCLAANVYITGLNQITDVAIDRINKPYLPIASGAYTMRKARWIVAICLVVAILSAAFYPTYLLATVLASIALGTAYSLPPIRLKRFHFWAAFCILAVRGFLVNLLLYLHFRVQLGGTAQLPPTIWLLTGLIFVFSIIIAWYKDLPDTEGDAAYQINTLSIRLGPSSVWWMGQALLVTALVSTALGYYYWMPADSRSAYLSLGLLACLPALGWLGSRLQFDVPKSIAAYYQGIWLLFFFIYGLFGFLA